MRTGVDSAGSDARRSSGTASAAHGAAGAPGRPEPVASRDGVGDGSRPRLLRDGDCSRRRFLRAGVAAALGLAGFDRVARISWADAGGAASAAGAASTTGATGRNPFGPLVSDPKGLFDLPAGFSYRIVSRAGETMSDGLRVPGAPDGMAAFAGAGGKIVLVRNHELGHEPRRAGPFGPDDELFAKVAPEAIYDPGRGGKRCLGGTTTLVFDPAGGRVERQFLSLAGTLRNCAGGATPWGSWISCEEPEVLVEAPDVERPHGYNFEVPALAGGPVRAEPLRAMGRFRHEAIAVEPRSGAIYQTEDRPDGLLYRFLPSTPGNLAAGGRLQALAVRDRPSLETRNWSTPTVAPREALAVRWIDLDDVEAPRDDLRLRGFAAGAARFSRGEGTAVGAQGVFFDCTDGGAAKSGQIWRYVPSLHEGTAEEDREPGKLELYLESAAGGLLEAPDNLAMAPWGDLIVCEDGSGDQLLLSVTPGGDVYTMARNAMNDTELAGATFSPDGRVLFLNLYGLGLTIAITGPWPAPGA